MFVPRTLNPRVRLVFLVVWFTGVSIGLLGALIGLIGNILGGSATATVDRINPQVGYSFSFATKSGQHCQTLREWNNDSWPIRLGDAIQVHYSRFYPCDNVERSDDVFAIYGFIAIPSIMLAFGIIVIVQPRRVRRRAIEPPGSP